VAGREGGNDGDGEGGDAGDVGELDEVEELRARFSTDLNSLVTSLDATLGLVDPLGFVFSIFTSRALDATTFAFGVEGDVISVLACSVSAILGLHRHSLGKWQSREQLPLLPEDLTTSTSMFAS